MGQGGGGLAALRECQFDWRTEGINQHSEVVGRGSWDVHEHGVDESPTIRVMVLYVGGVPLWDFFIMTMDGRDVVVVSRKHRHSPLADINGFCGMRLVRQTAAREGWRLGWMCQMTGCGTTSDSVRGVAMRCTNATCGVVVCGACVAEGVHFIRCHDHCGGMLVRRKYSCTNLRGHRRLRGGKYVVSYTAAGFDPNPAWFIVTLFGRTDEPIQFMPIIRPNESHLVARATCAVDEETQDDLDTVAQYIRFYLYPYLFPKACSKCNGGGQQFWECLDLTCAHMVCPSCKKKKRCPHCNKSLVLIS